MKLLTIPGRLLAVPFWLAVLVNLSAPFAAPFALLLNLAAAAVFALHLLQLALSHKRLKASASPTRDRLLLLLFGAFWLERLPSAGPVLAPLQQATRDVADALAQVAPAARSEQADKVEAA